MKNIVLLGSNGKVGKAFLIKKKNIYNIYSDLDNKIDNLLSTPFLVNNNIDSIVNCIGSIKNEFLFFHSNFFVPLSIADSLKDFSLVSDMKIIFIHLSSIGVNDPYGRLSLSPIDLRINQRSYLDFNKYEFSKCCADYSIKTILKKNEKVITYILQPSVIIEKKSQFQKKVFLFLLLFPFRVSIKSSPPITRLEYLISYLDNVIDDKNKNFSKNKDYVKTLQVFERIPLIKLFPSYKYISFFKIPIKKSEFNKLLEYFPNIYPFSSFKRIFLFLSFI